MTSLDVEDVFRRHGPAILRRATTILGDRSEADDVLQDVFRIVLAKRSAFGGRSAIGTWLYQVTTRACLNRMRRVRRRSALLRMRTDEVMPCDDERSPEIMAQLRQVLEHLPVDLAEVGIHYYVEGMTHDEIACVLGCSRRKVGNLLEKFQKRAAKIVASGQEMDR